MKPYFQPEFIQFFQQLQKNNTSNWFNENRKTYENVVKKPFAAFVEEMIRRIQKHEPEVQIKPGDAIMRINKDIRFSKDKTPYHTYVAANISAYGKKDKSYPGFYFQLSPEKISIYGGAYALENDVLLRLRNHISANTKAFAEAYNDKIFKEKYGKLQGEQNKRMAPEFAEVLQKEPLIANKQFYFSAETKPGIITSPELPDALMEYYTAAKKMNTFLRQAWK